MTPKHTSVVLIKKTDAGYNLSLRDEPYTWQFDMYYLSFDQVIDWLISNFAKHGGH